MVTERKSYFLTRNEFNHLLLLQENGLKKWLNFVLTPMDELNQESSSSSSNAPGKVDVGKLWKECSKNVRVPRLVVEPDYYIKCSGVITDPIKRDFLLPF